MMIEFFSKVGSVSADVGMYFLVFDAFLNRKAGLSVWSYRIGFLFLTGIIYVCNQIFLMSFFNIIGILFASFIVSFLYEGYLLKRMMSVSICALIAITAEIIVLYFLSLFLNISIEAIILIPDYQLMGVMLSKASALAVCYVLHVITKHRVVDIGRTHWMIFFLLYTNLVVVIFFLFRLSYDLDAMNYNSTVVICAFCLFFSITCAIVLYERQLAQSEKLYIQAQRERDLKAQIRHFDDLVVKQKELRKFKHDIFNQLMTLKGFFEKEDSAGGLRYIVNLTHAMDTAELVVDTGNIALDAILSTKKLLAESKGIVVSLKISISAHLPLEPDVVCAIFGNVFDNAIEGCSRVELNRAKIIELSLVQEENILLCKIRNTAQYNENESMRSSKMDLENHGFGLEILRDALARYGSQPEIMWKDGFFYLGFIIFLR